MKHPSGDGDAVYRIKIAAEVLVFIKDCRALGLRRGDLYLHVACWIRSSSSGDDHHRYWEIPIGGFAVKDRDNNSRIIGLTLIMWYQISGLLTARLC